MSLTPNYRRDEDLKNNVGQPVMGVLIYVCSQPANTSTVPPSPLVQLYADSTSLVPLKRPPQTDGYGHCDYYLPIGTYTICYYSTQIAAPNQMMVLPDQIVAQPQVGYIFNNDSSGVNIIGAIDGTNSQFQLSASPNPINSLVVAINGIVQSGWVVSENTLYLSSAPPVGSQITARYMLIPS